MDVTVKEVNYLCHENFTLKPHQVRFIMPNDVQISLYEHVSNIILHFCAIDVVFSL